MTDKEPDVLSPEIKFQLVRKLERHKVIGLAGTELKEHESKYLEFHRLSGVILFERNIESLPQVGELIASVDEHLAGDDDLTPFVMADHEGDFVSVLRKSIGVPPSAMAIAAAGDPQLAFDVAYETGTAMAKLGANVVLGPVADCYLDPESPITGLRAFGRDPERVAEYVVETIRGFAKAGILTCAKHFPGHGSTPFDSHETLPEVNKSLADLRSGELIPFEAAVEAGVDLIMTAHVAFAFGEESDDGTPASFDTRLIRGVLRKDLGFEGAVITDALEMVGAKRHAETRYGGLSSGFERTILAGSDLMLYSAPVPERLNVQDGSEPMIAVEVMQTIIDTLSRVVDRERIDAKLKAAAKEHEGIRNFLAILDESEQRVVRLRERAVSVSGDSKPKAGGNVIDLGHYPTTPVIYKTVAEQSLVLVRDPEAFLPVDGDAPWRLVPVVYHPNEALKTQDLQGFFELLCKRFPAWRVTAPVVGFEPDTTGMLVPEFAMDGGGTKQDETLAGDALLLPVLSARGTPPEAVLGKLSDFVEQRQVPFVIITGWPIIDWLPETTGALVTLGASPPVAAATAGVLAGETQATGSLSHVL